QLPLQNAVDSGDRRSHADGSSRRRYQEPKSCAYLAAGNVGARNRRWLSGFLLSRARSPAPSWRQETSFLQRHVWSPHLRTFAFCCLRICGHAGQPVTQRKQMTKLSRANPLSLLRTSLPRSFAPLIRSFFQRVLGWLRISRRKQVCTMPADIRVRSLLIRNRHLLNIFGYRDMTYSSARQCSLDRFVHHVVYVRWSHDPLVVLRNVHEELV